MESYNEFKKLMKEYNILLDKLLKLETEKVNIIASDNIEQLEKQMRIEEAEMLRMRGLDRKREDLLNKMGYEGKTFRQIVESSAADQKSELQPLYTQMKEKTSRLKELSASTSRMVDSKLVRIESETNRMKGGGANAYDQKGERVPSDSRPRMKPTSA
ncbi:MAG: flagellar protein FlgN [Firmicutes bacterium]|nr:flagellar protein FlgN [Bacillota bacterium]